MKTAPADIAGLARLILSQDCKSIAFLTGAGVSVAADIPDFRSPGGMYATLRPELLTASRREQDLMREDPTYVVSWDIFQRNQFPYLEVRRPFILGTQKQQWKATIAHRFMELVHTKTNKLTRVFTQNIDGLDRQCTEIPPDKIVGVHGTLGRASCEGCGREMEFNEFCDKVQSHIKDIYQQDASAPTTSTPIHCQYCHKPLVKPSTVLFGRQLPYTFFGCMEKDLPTTDLLFVAGTSLVVSPANLVVQAVPDTAIRVIVNREPVGRELGIDYDNQDDEESRDLFLPGNCDEVFLELIEQLGWMNDLQAKLDLLPSKSQDLVRQKMAG